MSFSDRRTIQQLERSPVRGADANTEVLARATRRTFAAEYNARVVGELDRCSELSAIGEILRRESSYSSLVAAWRKQLAKP